VKVFSGRDEVQEVQVKVLSGRNEGLGNQHTLFKHVQAICVTLQQSEFCCCPRGPGVQLAI